MHYVKFVANKVDLSLEMTDFTARLVSILILNLVFSKHSFHVLELLLLFLKFLHLLFGLLEFVDEFNV